MKTMSFKKTVLAVALAVGTMHGPSLAQADTFMDSMLSVVGSSGTIFTSLPQIADLDHTVDAIIDSAFAQSSVLKKGEEVIKAISSDIKKAEDRLAILNNYWNNFKPGTPQKQRVLEKINETKETIKTYSEKLQSSKGLQKLQKLMKTAGNFGTVMNVADFGMAVKNLYNTDWDNIVELSGNLFNLYDKTVSFIPLVGLASAVTHLLVVPAELYFNKKGVERDDLMRDLTGIENRITDNRANFQRVIADTDNEDSLRAVMVEYNQYLGKEILELEKFRDKVDSESTFMIGKGIVKEKTQNLIYRARSTWAALDADKVAQAREHHKALGREKLQRLLQHETHPGFDMLGVKFPQGNESTTEVAMTDADQLNANNTSGKKKVDGNKQQESKGPKKKGDKNNSENPNNPPKKENPPELIEKPEPELPKPKEPSTYSGGMAGVSFDATTWWANSEPGHVSAASSKDGKKWAFTLDHADTEQPTRFTIDTTATTQIHGRDVYKGKLDFLNHAESDRFDSAFYTTGAQDFFVFEWFNYDPTRSSYSDVMGYYGQRINATSQLAKMGDVSSYLLAHDMISTAGSGRIAHTPGNSLPYALVGPVSMKLFVNWKTGKVYGIDAHTHAQYWHYLDDHTTVKNGGTSLYVGDVDTDSFSLNGHYIYKPNVGEIHFTRSRTARNTSLQLYGKEQPNGIGGTFKTVTYDKDGKNHTSATQFRGFLKEKSLVTREPDNGNWSGFATGLFIDRKTGKVETAYNSASNAVVMTMRPDEGTVQANITVRQNGDGTQYKFSNTAKDSVYVNKDAFVAYKDLPGSAASPPSYAATTMAEHNGHDYLSWGVWNAEQTSASQMAMANDSYWIAGKLTQNNTMPQSGSARYVGQLHGAVYDDKRMAPGGAGQYPPVIDTLTGTIDLTATFGNKGRVSGDMHMRYASDNQPYASVTLSDDVKISGRLFKGDLGGDIKSGGINGAFYGPGAVEIGGNWHVKKDDKSQAVGVFAGKKTGGK